MSSSGYLASLLDQVQTVIDKTRFFLSSIPQADDDLGRGLARQLHSRRDLLTDLRDYTLLSKQELAECVGLVDQVLVPLEAHLSCSANQHARPGMPRIFTGDRGRPQYNIDLDRALQLHDMGNSWEDVSHAMGVDRKTLFNHLERAGRSKERIAYTDVDDEELDQYVATINTHRPLSGSIMVRGHLLAMGLNVQLGRVRESLRRVDEEGVLLRARGATRRRVYSVRGANALWHQDGNEKLKPWGFYVHGCVDGHSRMIIYLQCSNNKRSKTVGTCFKNAVSKYGWPSRVRGDYGTENNEIERCMVHRWGVAHRPYLRGRSVHNVRIERLWRDVRRDSLEFFRQIFLLLEKEHLLDPDDKTHLVALYLVYQHRIQQSLNETTTSWNNHSLRTERYRTPVALYELSREAAIRAGYWNSDVGDDVNGVDDLYGVEGDETELRTQSSPEPTAPRSDHFETLEEEIEAGIIVTDDEVIAEAREALGPLDLTVDDGSWGMDLYCEVVMRLSAFYADQSDDDEEC